MLRTHLRLLDVFDHEKLCSQLYHYNMIILHLFTAETPLGLYQGMTEQVVMSKTPGSFRTVLVPRGSSRPEWI